jgi:hypothetical protein
VIFRALPACGGFVLVGGVAVVLFVGDDWAEDHHDVEVQDHTGRRLGKAWLPEGVTGIVGFHELIAGFLDDHTVEDTGAEQVLVGIETDRGPWVAALVAAGYRVFAVNPRQVARYRERHASSGAKSDAGTRMRWPTWFAPTPTSYARSPGTAHWSRESRLSPGRIRR